MKRADEKKPSATWCVKVRGVRGNVAFQAGALYLVSLLAPRSALPTPQASPLHLPVTCQVEVRHAWVSVLSLPTVSPVTLGTAFIVSTSSSRKAQA